MKHVLGLTLGILAALLGAEARAADIGLQQVAAAVDADRRFEILAAGEDGHVYQRWQTAPEAAWSDWVETTPGAFSEVHSLTLSGRVFLFGLDAGALVIRAQANPGSGWSNDSVRTGHDLRQLAVTTNGEGGAEVIALGSDGVLYGLNSTSASPGMAPSDWSDWSNIGGAGLQEITVARDAGGHVTAAGLTNAGMLYLIQQDAPTADAGWREWDLLPAAGLHELHLARGVDHGLWLIALDNNGWIEGRSLAWTGPIASPAEMAAQAVSPAVATHAPFSPAQAAAAKGLVAPGRRDTTLVQPAKPLDNWSDWQIIAKQPFAIFNTLSVDTDAGGQIEIAGIANGANILHYTQNADGSWPQAGSLLPGDPHITQLSQVSLSTNRAGVSRVFVVEGSSKKIFTIAAPSDAPDSWPGQSWLSLGRFPGVAEPDIEFAAGACLEGLIPSDGLTAAEISDKANALRASISDGVQTKIGGAVKDTPLAGLLKNVNAASRCTPKGEMAAVWLNNEVWPGAFNEVPQLPDGSGFVYRIPAATLKTIIGGQIKEAIKKVKDIEIDGYDVELKAPNILEIDLSGKVLHLDFTATAVATFSIADQKPACTANLTASRPNGLYAIAGTFFVPAVGLGSLVQFGDAYEGEQVDAVSAKVQLVCSLTDAILSNLFLPRDPGKTQPLKELKIPYDRITLDNIQGLVASGGVPTIVSPSPSVQIGYFPVSPMPVANTTLISTAFFAKASDMSAPLTYSWTPANTWSLKLADHPGLGGKLDNFAFFAFGINPDPTPKPYDLGTMSVTVTDSEGQVVTATTPSVVISTLKTDH